MTKSKDNIYTGNTQQGNPYIGDLDRGINYDAYESSFFLIDQVEDFPKLSRVYKTGSKRLVDRLNLKNGDRVLDVGSGTGISTLEILPNQIDKVILAGIKFRYPHKNQNHLKKLGMDILKKLKLEINYESYSQRYEICPIFKAKKIKNVDF